MKNFSFFLLLLSISVVVDGSFAQDIPAELKGNLVVRDGEKVKLADDARLSGTKYFGLYYSAGWCGPCRTFTPSLVKFYNEMKPKHPDFEIILISADRTEPAMAQYMADMSMPWPALTFAVVREKRALLQYVCEGIPCLVLVDQKGKVLSHTMVDQEYMGPGKVVEDLRTLLQGGALEAAAPSPPPLLALPSPAPATSTTPSGEN